MSRRTKIGTAALVVLGGVFLFSLKGCLSLPPPAPATAPSAVNDTAPAFALARSDAPPEKATLAELTGGKTHLVLIFYRGKW